MKHPLPARRRSENATFSIGAEARKRLAWLVGRHVTMTGRAAVSASDVLRDLIARAYTRLR